VKTVILIADLVMSVDNVIAIAAAAKGSTLLLMLGLAISIPLVVFGSTLMIKLMERFPIIVTLGAALIGWVGGETIVSDVALKGVAAANPWLHYAAAAGGAALVIGLGKFLNSRRTQAAAEPDPALPLICNKPAIWAKCLVGRELLVPLPGMAASDNVASS
jgi:predicted tellurium resistance membrane protein TerC